MRTKIFPRFSEHTEAVIVKRYSVKKVFLKETPTQVFSCQICEIFKNTYSEEHLRATASKHRSSFLGVFCRSCCSALMRWWNISFSEAVVQSWRVLHGNLLKISLHHKHVSKNSTTVAKQRYWKIYLDGCFWGRIYLETFLHECFSKAAADVYSF